MIEVKEIFCRALPLRHMLQHRHEGHLSLLQHVFADFAHFDEYLREFLRAEIFDDAVGVHQAFAAAFGGAVGEVLAADDGGGDVIGGEARHHHAARQGLEEIGRGAFLGRGTRGRGHDIGKAVIDTREFGEDLHERAFLMHADTGQFVFFALDNIIRRGGRALREKGHNRKLRM